MNMQHQQTLLDLLKQQLSAARAHDDTIRQRNQAGTVIHVPGIGKKLSSAYEQLRNAAEYAEEHLLLQRAIRRFYHRNASFFMRRPVDNLDDELIVELTQAGYLHNSSFSAHTVAELNRMAQHYMETYWRLRDSNVPRDQSMDWVLSIWTVETEALLNPHSHHTALAYCAYQHYLQLLPRNKFIENEQEALTYDISLYIAVHQALLKSDLAIVRHDLMRMYHQSPHDLPAFIEFNQTVSALTSSSLTLRLVRAITKTGAPLRILKSMTDDRPDVAELLHDREQFLGAYGRQVSQEYKEVNRRLNRGILKSIAFLFITKTLIGVSVEIPYDLVTIGIVKWMPLVINLLFPPLYMASLKLGIKVPSLANGDALKSYIDKVLFSNELPLLPILKNPTARVSNLFKFLYSLFFFIPFAFTVYCLSLLHFNVVQGAIFFIFLSTASFLGFRLSRRVRELEIVTHQTGFLSTLRDFFYLPFILVGQWLSRKYAKVNVVAYVLDIAIELPLKTVLRLVRQWTRFLNEKHEEIY